MVMTVTPTETLSTYLEGVTTGEATAQRGKSPKSPVHPYRSQSELYRENVRKLRPYEPLTYYLHILGNQPKRVMKK